MDLEKYGIDVGLVISGLFGAVLMTSKDVARNYGKTISSLVGGAASANYITPLITSIAKFDNIHFTYSISFLLGFAGLKSIEKFSNMIVPEHVVTEEVETPAEKPRRRRKPVQH